MSYFRNFPTIEYDLDDNKDTRTIVDVFTTMTLSFSGGTKTGGNYSTSHNEPSGTEVWPTSGTWTFQNGDKNKLLRNYTQNLYLLKDMNNKP